MNDYELESMRQTFQGLKERISPLKNSPKIKRLQNRVINIRKEAIDNNDELIDEIKENFKANDIDCFYAEDDQQARNIILDLINSEIEKNDYDKNNINIAKSKSNTLREVNISSFLESQGMNIIETDLGDRILQLKENDNEPVHPTGPASHLKVKGIADIVNKAMGVNVPPEPRSIMEVVREDVLEKLATSNIGISGANSIAAEDGAILLVHNEGNISIVASKKLHIVLVGIDKIVPSLEDSVSIAKLETVYATGKPLTSYINIISGPSKTADIEKKLLKNMYGAEKVAVILLDNGRKEAMDECLWCIGCGNCIVSCPVYNIVGNKFGYAGYLGGRGVAMSKFIEGGEKSFNSGLYMCTLCGMCTENCPVATPTNEIIENLRNSSRIEGYYKKEHQNIKNNINKKGSPF